MPARIIYLDSSAILKLVFEEPETTALEVFLEQWPVRVSSAIARVEVMRIAAQETQRRVVSRSTPMTRLCPDSSPDSRTFPWLSTHLVF